MARQEKGEAGSGSLGRAISSHSTALPLGQGHPPKSKPLALNSQGTAAPVPLRRINQTQARSMSTAHVLHQRNTSAPASKNQLFLPRLGYGAFKALSGCHRQGHVREPTQAGSPGDSADICLL